MVYSAPQSKVACGYNLCGPLYDQLLIELRKIINFITLWNLAEIIIETDELCVLLSLPTRLIVIVFDAGTISNYHVLGTITSGIGTSHKAKN